MSKNNGVAKKLTFERNYTLRLSGLRTNLAQLRG